MYDLIVIGGGPAALVATVYALGKQLNVAMIYEELGGKIGWLESLIGPGRQPDLPGADLTHLLTRRITAQPGRTLDDRVLSVALDGRDFSVVTERHGALHSRTALVATGAAALPLNIPGAEQLDERRLSASITTYAHLTEGQRVAVIGSNNRALSGAAELAELANHVSIVAPNPLALTTPLGQALSQHERVELLEGWEATRIDEQGERVTLTLARQGQQRALSVDRIFVALGLAPRSEIVRDLVATDAHGFILVNTFHETSMPGLFAAGDVSSIFCEHVLAAIGDGARAAITAYDYLLAQRLVPSV